MKCTVSRCNHCYSSTRVHLAAIAIDRFLSARSLYEDQYRDRVWIYSESQFTYSFFSLCGQLNTNLTLAGDMGLINGQVTLSNVYIPNLFHTSWTIATHCRLTKELALLSLWSSSPDRITYSRQRLFDLVLLDGVVLKVILSLSPANLSLGWVVWEQQQSIPLDTSSDTDGAPFSACGWAGLCCVVSGDAWQLMNRYIQRQNESLFAVELKWEHGWLSVHLCSCHDPYLSTSCGS